MNDVIVMQCVGSRIGEHRVKQCELLISRWRDTFRNPSISFDHDGMHPPIVAVANEADRIGSQPVDSFTGVGKLTLPGKHPPCSNQRGSIRHGVFHPHFKPAYTYAYTYIVISQAHRRSKSHTTADSFTAANNVIGPAEQRYASCAPQIEDRTLPYLQDVGRDMCIAEK